MVYITKVEDKIKLRYDEIDGVYNKSFKTTLRYTHIISELIMQFSSRRILTELVSPNHGVC
jgi:hypothetical protein